MAYSSKTASVAPISAPRRGGVATKSPWERLPVPVRRLILLALIVVIWQLYVTTRNVSPLLFPAPASVARAFIQGWTDGVIPQATLATLKVLGLGMVIGVISAVLLTTLATWTRVGEDLLILLTSMLNPLPSIAILPLAMLWFGLNTSALVFVLTNAVIWPIAINITMGFRTVNPTLIMVGRNLGLSGWKMVKDVLMPAALPHTIAGLKTGWAFGWRTIIAAELVFGVAGAQGGLGTFINESRYFLRTPDVFAGLITIALIGIVFETIFNYIERRTVIRWGMKEGS